MAKDIDVELGLEEDSEDEELCNEKQINSYIPEEHSPDIETLAPKLLETCNITREDTLQEKSTAKQERQELQTDYSSDGSNENNSDGSYSDRLISGSVRSSTTTIPPDEIKKRLRRQMYTKEKKEQRKKCVAKGEASAVTRKRRENADTIKQSHGIWGWD